MTDHDILQAFKEKVCREVEIEKQGLDRYIIYTPFAFDDGDHYVVLLKRENNKWVLTDEGHTLMHLSYSGIDLLAGQRGELVKGSLMASGLENRSGELILDVPDEQFGDALFSYLQVLNRVQSTALWTRERVSSTFREDFQALMRESVPGDKLEFDYADPIHDPGGTYAVDSRQWVVAYYDLLGIKQEMRDWSNPRSTRGKIAEFRSMLTHPLLSAINRNLDKRSQNKPDITKTRECEFRTFGFADTMVIASPLVNRFGVPQPMALSILLTTMLPLSAGLLENGILFRAGVELGIAQAIRPVADYFTMPDRTAPPLEYGRFSEGDIAGPAYIAAHDLASRSGSPPGMFVGQAAVALLNEAANGNGRFRDAWAPNAKQALGLLMRLESKNGFNVTPDGDVWAVDFARLEATGANSRDPTYRKTQESLRAGYGWVLNELKRDRQDNVRQKFLWLKNYLEGRGISGSSPRSRTSPDT